MYRFCVGFRLLLRFLLLSLLLFHLLLIFLLFGLLFGLSSFGFLVCSRGRFTLDFFTLRLGIWGAWCLGLLLVLCRFFFTGRFLAKDSWKSRGHVLFASHPIHSIGVRCHGHEQASISLSFPNLLWTLLLYIKRRHHVLRLISQLLATRQHEYKWTIVWV